MHTLFSYHLWGLRCMDNKTSQRWKNEQFQKEWNLVCLCSSGPGGGRGVIMVCLGALSIKLNAPQNFVQLAPQNLPKIVERTKGAEICCSQTFWVVVWLQWNEDYRNLINNLHFCSNNFTLKLLLPEIFSFRNVDFCLGVHLFKVTTVTLNESQKGFSLPYLILSI